MLWLQLLQTSHTMCHTSHKSLLQQWSHDIEHNEMF